MQIDRATECGDLLLLNRWLPDNGSTPSLKVQFSILADKNTENDNNSNDQLPRPVQSASRNANRTDESMRRKNSIVISDQGPGEVLSALLKALLTTSSCGIIKLRIFCA